MSGNKVARNKIAVIVGSARNGSINRALAQALIALGADRFDAKIVRIDDLPMYNQDLEAALPESVSRFKAALEAADGVLIVTPEHSRSIPALLKNAIDWAARPWGKSSWPGKVAAIIGATPGAIGTAIAQMHLRQVLGAQGVVVLGGETYITFKDGLIDDKDQVTDDSTRTFLKSFVDQFASLVARFAPAAQSDATKSAA